MPLDDVEGKAIDAFNRAADGRVKDHDDKTGGESTSRKPPVPTYNMDPPGMSRVIAAGHVAAAPPVTPPPHPPEEPNDFVNRVLADKFNRAARDDPGHGRD